MTQGPNIPDITTREGFAAAAAPLSRLLLSVSYGVLHSWDLAADAAQSALLTAVQIPVIHAVARLVKQYREKVAQ